MSEEIVKQEEVKIEEKAVEMPPKKAKKGLDKRSVLLLVAAAAFLAAAVIIAVVKIIPSVKGGANKAVSLVIEGDYDTLYNKNFSDTLKGQTSLSTVKAVLKSKNLDDSCKYENNTEVKGEDYTKYDGVITCSDASYTTSFKIDKDKKVVAYSISSAENIAE